MNKDEIQLSNLPFKVAIIEQDSHFCAICLFKSKYSEEKITDPSDCTGCDIYQSTD